MQYKRTFQIGAEEMVRFNLNQMMRKRFGGMVALGIAGALSGILYSDVLNLGSAGMLPMAIMGFFTVFLVVFLFFFTGVKKQVRKGMAGLNGSSYEQTVLVDPFGIHVSANGKTAKLSFDKIYMVRETAKDVFIFVTAEQAWLLPKNQMAYPKKECRDLYEILEPVVESKKLKFKGKN